MTPPRTLLVLRHAKAAHQPGMSDVERPLTPRGRRDASAAGAWLLAQNLLPDRVVCSSARRTSQTWQQVLAALGPSGTTADVSFERRAYDADAPGLLSLVAEQPDEEAAVMLVGHNPASHQLVLSLTAREDLAFPTCALAVIQLEGDWAAAGPGGGTLAAFWQPPVAD